MATLKDTIVTGDLSVTHNINIGGNLNFTSDRRYKENISDISNQELLNKIQHIKVKRYNYINSMEPQMGIIAQDLEEYLPEYHNELIDIINDQDNSGYTDKRVIHENKLIFILWQAVQELIQQNKEIIQQLDEISNKENK